MYDMARLASHNFLLLSKDSKISTIFYQGVAPTALNGNILLFHLQTGRTYGAQW